MSWRIANLVNTVAISKKCAKDLFDASMEFGDEIWLDVDSVIEDGKLSFSSDAMEHMDYLWNDHIQAVLLKHKVSGDVCFGSLEGDNAGSFWGYRFDGKGVVINLKGELSWKGDL